MNNNKFEQIIILNYKIKQNFCKYNFCFYYFDYI